MPQKFKSRVKKSKVKVKRVWLPFEQADIPITELRKVAHDLQISMHTIAAEMKHLTIYKNNHYQVAVRHLDHLEPRIAWLSIKRIDRQPIHDWRDLQRIKNELIGEENEGVELYPAESRCVDLTNQYHLFVIKDPQYRFPFGFDERARSELQPGKTRQRPFDT